MIGGLIAWGVAWRGMANGADERAARLVRLCARYWHFLFGIWLLLFSTLAGVTPEIVRRICGLE